MFTRTDGGPTFTKHNWSSIVEIEVYVWFLVTEMTRVLVFDFLVAIIPLIFMRIISTITDFFNSNFFIAFEKKNWEYSFLFACSGEHEWWIRFWFACHVQMLINWIKNIKLGKMQTKLLAYSFSTPKICLHKWNT